MNASELLISDFLANLTQSGVQLSADQDKLRIHSPKGVMSAELQKTIATRKAEILRFLKEKPQVVPGARDIADRSSTGLSLQTLGRIIGGFCQAAYGAFIPPIIDPQVMADQLRVTFKPLPPNYTKTAIRDFRTTLEQQLKDAGVQLIPWEEAIKPFNYEINIPFTPWKYTIKTHLVKSSVSAVIDVERHPNWFSKAKIWIAESLYKFYSRFVWGERKLSVVNIAQFISWAEESMQPLENHTNTQVIVLTDFNPEFTNPDLPYQQKIPIGVNTLVKNFSEIVIGVSETQVSILNMNLSDSVFDRTNMASFVAKSLIPKIYVPIYPLSLSRFEVSTFDPTQSSYAADLVKLGQALASTQLLPSGFKINDVIPRQSHRDIVDWMANGRTGVSYGFVAYIEPPQYYGPIEATAAEWQEFQPLAEFDPNELRQNSVGRRYLKIQINNQTVYKQIPDIWLVSSKSGAKKTDLNLNTDVLRMGLQDRLLLQLPEGIDPVAGDIKPSYDTYVMVAIALAAALYAPDLVKDGAPMMHFHGYPNQQWFQANEYCAGVNNPSVPCGTYESGVFNFLGIQQLVQQYGSHIALASLVEPDHGTNFIARDLDYLITRVNAGIEQKQIELGGRHFISLKDHDRQEANMAN
jgi:TubC N-terminal docking domain